MLSSAELISKLGLIPHPEGGYFLETHRSGSTPMTTKGQTDFNVQTGFTCNTSKDELNVVTSIRATEPNSDESLTIAPNRIDRRPDGDIRRNCLTSIIWMPTRKSPKLQLVVNLSDHVHYYHGGDPFKFYVYDPKKGELLTEILGPDIAEGHKLQVAVRGGLWKCGLLLQSDKYDYCLIGEAVAPGFDFHDFTWVTKSDILGISNGDDQQLLIKYLHADINSVSGKEVQIAELFYE